MLQMPTATNQLIRAHTECTCTRTRSCTQTYSKPDATTLVFSLILLHTHIFLQPPTTSSRHQSVHSFSLSLSLPFSLSSPHPPLISLHPVPEFSRCLLPGSSSCQFIRLLSRDSAHVTNQLREPLSQTLPRLSIRVSTSGQEPRRPPPLHSSIPPSLYIPP